ncbi:MAG: hypothetical protein KA885_11540, partial [Spirochaetes bacterium]|nr:hypothetical protein [Spirochaetota bacterium]
IEPVEYFPSKPEASAVNDNSNDGIYKGVITGKNITGSFKMVANNDIPDRASSNPIYVILNFNGETVTIDGDVSVDGQFYRYTFQNIKYNLVINLTFKGSIENTNLTVAGLDMNNLIDISVYKETSVKLVKAYEGTFSGSGPYTVEQSYTIEGVWNTVIEESKTKGACYWKPYISGEPIGIIGVLSGDESGDNTWNILLNDGLGTATGKVYERYASGTWTVGSDTGTWYGKRKF